MRIILYCLGLLFAAPALASSVEDGLCHARPQPVERMEKSEKLCRAFIRALGKVPGEAMKDVQVMLSPESLALMGTMTTADPPSLLLQGCSPLRGAPEEIQHSR